MSITTLGVGLFLALIVAAWEFVGLRSVKVDDPIQALESPPVPWGGLAARRAARLLETRWRFDVEAAEAGLLWQLGRYPLDPWRWLLFSRIAFARGSDQAELAEILATAISVQPDNRELRWQAANLAQSTGQRELVLRQLRLLLEISPRETARALFIGARWTADAAQLLETVLPPGEEYLEQAMRHARRNGSMALAEAVWTRLNAARPASPIEADHPAFSDYIHVALRHDPDKAMAAWQTVDPDYRPGDVPAGHFSYEKELLPAFGWSLRVPAGVVVERVEDGGRKAEDGGRRAEDGGRRTESGGRRAEGGRRKTEDGGRKTEDGATTGPNQNTKTPKHQNTRQANALRISFNGEHNVRLTTPHVSFPVPEPGRYRLSGWWRAGGLTTRALPYLWLDTRSEDHRSRGRVDVPAPAFEWTRFEIDFETHERNQTVVFRLRRDSTDAFDRYIEGELFLAGLDTERLLPSTARPTLSTASSRD